MDPVFVLPLEKRFVCSVHGGVLRNPVAVGNTRACRECIKLEDANNAAVDETLKAEIDQLLCYCKYGVVDGHVREDGKGCDFISNYGNREQHEASCPFNEKDFIMLGDKEAHNTEDIHALRELLQKSEQKNALLERELRLRDETIAALRKYLEDNQPETTVHMAKVNVNTFKKRAQEGGKELWDELSKVFGEEIPEYIGNAVESFVRSPTYQRSSSALSSLKNKLAVKTDDVAKSAADLHPLDRLIAALVSLKGDMVNSAQNISSGIQNATISSPTQKRGNDDDDDDDDAEAAVKASLKSFEEEQVARRLEDAALATATAMSLQSPSSPSS